MSPPSRARADPEAEVATPSRERPAEHAEPTAELGSAHAAILATQQAAGNRAVADALRGKQGVQRAPNDDGGDGATSYAAPSVAPPPRSGATSYAAPSVAPPGSGQATGAQAPAPTGAPGGDAAAPPTSALPVPAGMFGGVNPLEKRQTLVAPRAVHMQSEVDVAYQIRPQTVIRSPNENWHFNAWYHSNNGKVDETQPIPQMFKVGGQYYVAPDYKGGATELPVIAAVGGAGTTAPAPGGRPVEPGRGGPATPRVLETHGPPPDRLRWAVSPETPASGPRGSVQAQKATYQEVATALAKNPQSVVRSPNQGWHAQGFKLDGGDGAAPFVYRVGNLYIIAPDHPLPGVPKLGESLPPKPSALPQAAQIVSLPGTSYSDRSALKSYTATTTESGGRTETRTRSREQAVVTTATEVSEGGITNRQEKQRGGGFGAGGNLLGVVAGQTDTSKIEGDVVAAKKSTQVTAGLGKDLKLGAEAKSTKEIVTGTDPEGNPIKQSTTTKVGGKADFSGWQAGASRERTSAKGTTTGAGGGLKGDWKGNVELEAFVNLQTKGGVSFKPTVSHGIKVEASEPIKVPGGFDIVYRIIETTGAGLGAGKQLGGGATVGVNVGATEAEFQGGRRTFKTEDEANAFRDNAATRVATEQMAGVALPPTTVAGAMQIPVGETRTTGEISGKSIGASGGYAGFTLAGSKQKSQTRELAVKRTGASIVEVTGSTTGSKTGTIGASVPVLSHGYSSTESTTFALTFEFDLSKEQGRAAFELYVKTGWPPGKPKVIEKSGSQADNENFAIPGLGTVVWTGTTWQVSRETSEGSITSVYGGAQIHEQKPGAIGKVLGEDTLKSNAQIVRVVQDGEEVGARAQFTVGGTSGEYNRKELGKIFTGARTGGDVKPSGEWSLSAPVPKEKIDELHRVSKKIRNAIDERQAYSELVKEHGAGMLGGQVGMTSRNWDLELKGDPNFPGEKERERLKDLRKILMARIRSNPELANDIVRETGEELAKLAKRREAVADMKKYTDLPDGLREQQLGVIDMHVDDMKVVRRTAQAVAMKKNAGERAADVAARVDKEDKAAARPARKGGARAGKGGADVKATAVEDESKKADAEYAKTQDRVSAKESRIAAKRNEIREFSKALGDAIGAKGSTAVRFGADSATVQVAIASGKGYIGAATDADKKQAALDPEVERLRDAWSAAADQGAKLEAIKALEKVLDERLKLMDSCLHFIREAGKAVFHITTRSAKSGNPYFWGTLGLSEADED